MLERFFEIEDFRSVGIGKKEYLDLNYLSSKEGSYGGIVTIIGENNSGKSNVLEAIKKFNNKSFDSDKDLPFNDTRDNISPQITMILKDNKKDLRVKIRVSDKKTNFEIYEKTSLLTLEDLEKDDKNDVFSQESISFVKKITNNKNMISLKNNENFKNLFSKVEPILLEIKNQKRGTKISQTGDKYRTVITNLYLFKVLKHYEELDNYEEIRRGYEEFKKEFSRIVDHMYNRGKKDLTFENNLKENFLKDNFNIERIPEILEYKEEKSFGSSDILSNISYGSSMIKNPSFFEKLFSLIDGHNYKDLVKIYEKFYNSNMLNKSILTNYSNKINKAIDSLSKQFNEIYTFDDSKKYKFRLILEKNEIYFMVSENDHDLNLDSQSTGFKWFFNFFFNVFANSNLKSGDIIILDEPATSLHVSGQIELRKQIKDFGYEKGITFIIATHSPFLIDPDHLDDLRIVTKSDFNTKIKNKFSVGEGDDELDVMMPIKTALTVSRHILTNPEDTLVFVEGITDYNYLISAKKILNNENIVFMPIQGIRRDNLYNKLLKISKFPILLVDSDNAGKAVYEKYKNKKGMEVIRLEDIDEKFIEIEDIFSDTDKNKFFVNEKNYRITSAFKNEIVYNKNKYSPKTKENFKKIFTRLSE